MGVVNSTFVTISCDAAGCGKTATFGQSPADEAAAFEANPWLNTLRFVQTVDKRSFGYCSDVCEVTAAGTGAHNKLEAKKIVPGGQAQIDLAAQAAARAAQATAALKSGSGITLE